MHNLAMAVHILRLSATSETTFVSTAAIDMLVTVDQWNDPLDLLLKKK